MPTAKYKVTINGFTCNRQSFDDAFNWDGKGDEVCIAVGYKRLNRDGVVLRSTDPNVSSDMGDTWNQPNRVRAGSASANGGIISGDTFPSPTPWVQGLNAGNYPPYTIWEEDLTQGGDVVYLTPTIWERDPGTSFFDTLVAWHVAIDNQMGQKAKDVYAGRWPVAGWFFDAISLGIQTAGQLRGIWGPVGASGDRPIGIQRDPAVPGSRDAVVFNPQFLMLNYDMAEDLIANNPHGKGNGVIAYRYVDDNYLAGDYTLYLQVERVGGPVRPYPDGSLIKEVSRAGVYVVMGDMPFHVPDPATLDRLYPPGFAAVHPIPDGTIATLPVVPRDGTLLREESAAEVWLFQAGQKRHITSPQVLVQWGGWAMVRVVPNNAVAAFPVGAPV